MFSYRLIIKQALNIAWSHKYLWLFGLFATIVAASGSFEYQFLSGSIQSGILENPYFYATSIIIALEALGLFILGIVDLFKYDVLTIINTFTVLIIVLTILVSFIWLSISSQGALVASSHKLISSKKKISSLSIRKFLTIGHQKFWPVLGLNILVKVATIIILSVISLPLIYLISKYSVSLTLVYTFAFIILVPLVVAVSFMIKYAIAYIILDDEDFFDAIIKSWIMFKNNWLVSIEMGIILFLISFLVGFLLVIGLSVIVLPYLIFAIDYSMIALIVILAIISLFLILIVGSFLTTFQITAWTNIFMELKKGNGQAKLERVFNRR